MTAAKVAAYRPYEVPQCWSAGRYVDRRMTKSARHGARSVIVPGSTEAVSGAPVSVSSVCDPGRCENRPRGGQGGGCSLVEPRNCQCMRHVEGLRSVDALYYTVVEQW